MLNKRVLQHKINTLIEQLKETVALKMVNTRIKAIVLLKLQNLDYLKHYNLVLCQLLLMQLIGNIMTQKQRMSLRTVRQTRTMLF
jgi:hypothetical protein